jgi:hypothetical protein
MVSLPGFQAGKNFISCSWRVSRTTGFSATSHKKRILGGSNSGKTF